MASRAASNWIYRAVGDDDIRSFSSRTFRPENSSTLIYNTKK